ncbi:hypothetical protein STRATTON_268 [Erwinia phage vB_EamM_Stratton]|uniref:Uncharacterized protein n=2 Tax=Erskinevirus EaH2 TaxID=2169883 RepID=A0A1B2IHI2_9CAUD|nr:hypothetical protein G173_gp166 [Erwinia phage phiEaH2]AFQ96711.1 hypothetical protein [Erwinia phage phiEaH2]ANZ50693.1 hypothetical protein STRATTON_268 [Erwinia phage vB_EamM_Stratton]
MSEAIDPSLERWREQQMPSVAKKLTLRQLSNPPLHLSKCKIPVFSPRIPLSVARDEDMTVPRICCSVDLSRCIHGVRHIYSTIEIPTRLYLYGFEERAVAQPSVDLTCEPNRAGEVWIVPHRMSNWDIKPTLLGELRLSSLGAGGHQFTYQMCFGQDVRLSSDQLLKADTFYEVKVTVNWEKETIKVSDAKQVDRSKFDIAINEYSVTP